MRARAAWCTFENNYTAYLLRVRECECARALHSLLCGFIWLSLQSRSDNTAMLHFTLAYSALCIHDLFIYIAVLSHIFIYIAIHCIHFIYKSTFLIVFYFLNIIFKISYNVYMYICYKSSLHIYMYIYQII